MSARDHFKHDRELREKLGALSFEYRGMTKNGHHIFVHEQAGHLIASAKPNANSTKQAVRDANRKIRVAHDINHQFEHWLLVKYSVDHTDTKDVEFRLSDEVTDFLYDSGERFNAQTIAQWVRDESTRVTRVGRIDWRRPQKWRLKGHLVDVEMVESQEVPTDNNPPKPVPLRAVTDPAKGKDIHLVHRFDDTIKMYLTQAGITTTQQLRDKSWQDLTKIPGLKGHQARLNVIKDFLNRGDDPEVAQIPPDAIDAPVEKEKPNDVTLPTPVQADAVIAMDKLREIFTEELRAQLETERTKVALAKDSLLTALDVYEALQEQAAQGINEIKTILALFDE